MSLKAMLRPIFHRAVACARVQSSCVLFSQLYPCNRLLFLRQVSSSLPSHNTSAQDLQLKLLREHEEAEAAFATERAQRVPELARAATDMMKFQDTPNPNSLKFVPGCPVLGVGGGTLDLPTARAAMVSPLAKAIFRVDDVSGVFLGADFITVTKRSDDQYWGPLKVEVASIIIDFFASGAPVVAEGVEMHKDTAVHPGDSETVQMIKELLDTRIRPAVQDDGGDIEYVGYNAETGVVQVRLQGACSTCASSKLTLKGGVESMLLHYCPEVKSVEEVVSSEIEEASNSQLKFVEDMTGGAGA